MSDLRKRGDGGGMPGEKGEWMKLWKSCLILAACLAAGGCKSSSKVTMVAVSPTAAALALQNTLQFTASVQNASDTTVVWKVNDVVGGSPTTGTISTNGLYTAPSTIPSPATVTIKAVSNANSSATATATVTLTSGVSITVSPTVATMGTGEMLTLTATLIGTTNNSTNWLVSSTATGTFTAGGSATLGTIPTPTTTAPPTCSGTVCATGVYTAPATAPTGGLVVVEAQATVDSSRVAQATVSIVTATNPTLTSVTPTLTAAGSVFQDFYLTGTNFLSTTSVIIGGNPVPAARVNPSTLRARAPASLLAFPATLTVAVQRQGGALTPSLSVNVVPERPVLVSALPESAAAGPGTVTYEFDGGYFGAGVTGDFDNQPQFSIPPATPNPQKLQVSIGNGALATPGLFSVGVNNPAAAPSRSAVNIALQPTVAPAVTNTIGSGVLNQPLSVAVDTGLGIAVVVNGGSSGVNANSLSLVDLSSKLITATFPLGNSPTTGLQPTAVAVDNERDLALVTDNASSDVAVVNLVSHAVTTLTGIGTAPFGVGVDPVHGQALVVNQSTNMATIIDLTTLPPGSPATTACGMPVVCTPVSISTGPTPHVAVLPQLGWAMVTPGGAGLLSVVDLVRKSVVFTAAVNLTVVGAAMNTETERLLLADPSSPFVSIFSLEDQAVSSVSLELGHIAAAVNPLTNIGVTVNDITNAASIIDLQTPTRLATLAVGSNPRAVAIDPGTDQAVVANQNDGTVSIIDLGALTTHPQIVQMDPPLTMTSGSAAPLTIIGSGFAPGAMVRFNGTTTVVPTTLTPRRITALIPASLLAQANRIVVDVQNPGNVFSNVENLVVIQQITVGTAPRAVAIDPQREIAVVTNSTSNNVSIVDLDPTHIGTYGTVLSTITVGTTPAGVAVLSRTGQAVVANEGNGTASVLDLVGNTVTATVSTGGQPRGVAINPATGFAYVSNSASNSLSAFILTATGTPVPATVSVDQRPGAMAIAPDLNLLALADETANNLLLFDITAPLAVVLRNRIVGLQLPTGVVYDPVSQVFIGLSSLGNNLVIVNPTTGQVSSARVGINPTSVAYNFQTSTLLTVNNASNTLSVMDFPSRRVRSILSLAGSSQFAVDIHLRTNIAALVDTANNRLLLVPMPR